MARGASAQDLPMPGTESLGVDSGAPPVVRSGGGSYFSQDLGTILRLRYNTESYGQNGHGNFDVGTMQVFSFDGSTVFFDGQVTMNEVQGVGFNVGAGSRVLTYPSFSPDGRIAGLSLWADGTSSDEGGFFPQVGLSAESLGETWDFRANGYIPVGQDDQLGPFEGTGVTGFSGFSLGELTQAVLNSSYYAAELEVARRLGSERDAWAFAGPYYIAHDGDNSADTDDDSPGVRAGLRGYAYPDLMLQIGVTHDEIFDTNATFSVIWFVGRTRTDFHPACGVEDRFREPVLRNDYVVLSQRLLAGIEAFTQPDGDPLRFVHVDSTAGPGGDGTFENPFDILSDINGAGSQEGDIILAHAESVFTGDVSTTLKDEQRLLGEGDDFEATVATDQGTFVIPETAPGAREAARPMIVGAAPGGDAIVLANANEVANFDIDGDATTARAIASPAAGSGNPNLHDLDISNTTGNAIDLTPLEEVDTDDVDNDGNTTETFVRGNVTINQVTFDNIGGNDINIDADTSADIMLPNVTLQEVINLTNITSTNGNGTSINVENTHSGAGRTVNVNNFTYDGGTTSDGDSGFCRHTLRG